MVSMADIPYLAVEDRAPDRIQLQKVLGEGSAVISSDPQTALEHLQDGNFKAVILDLYMPRMDGWTFLEEARRVTGGAGQAPAFIILSGDDTPENRARAKEQGVHAFVAKGPGFANRLRAALDQL